MMAAYGHCGYTSLLFYNGIKIMKNGVYKNECI